MNIFYKGLLPISLILTLGAFQAFAAEGTGVAAKYEVTMKKMELCTGPPASETDVTCPGLVLVGEGTQAFESSDVRRDLLMKVKRTNRLVVESANVGVVMARLD